MPQLVESSLHIVLIAKSVNNTLKNKHRIIDILFKNTAVRLDLEQKVRL
jgi:hypothetical protein